MQKTYKEMVKEMERKLNSTGERPTTWNEYKDSLPYSESEGPTAKSWDEYKFKQRFPDQEYKPVAQEQPTMESPLRSFIGESNLQSLYKRPEPTKSMESPLRNFMGESGLQKIYEPKPVYNPPYREGYTPPPQQPKPKPKPETITKEEYDKIMADYNVREGATISRVPRWTEAPLLRMDLLQRQNLERAKGFGYGVATGVSRPIAGTINRAFGGEGVTDTDAENILKGYMGYGPGYQGQMKTAQTGQMLGETGAMIGGMMAGTPLLTPLGSGFLAGALDVYGKGGTTEDVLKGGTSMALFSGAGSVGGRLLGGIAGKGIQSSALANTVLGKTLEATSRGVGFGLAGTGSQEFISDWTGYTPTAKDYALNSLFGAVFESLPASLNAIKNKRFQQSQVMQGMKTYEGQMKQKYFELRNSNNPDARLKLYDEIIDSNKNILKALNTNEFIGARQQVLQAKKTVDMLLGLMRRERANLIFPEGQKGRIPQQQGQLKPSVATKWPTQQPKPVSTTGQVATTGTAMRNIMRDLGPIQPPKQLQVPVQQPQVQTPTPRVQDFAKPKFGNKYGLPRPEAPLTKDSPQVTPQVKPQDMVAVRHDTPAKETSDIKNEFVENVGNIGTVFTPAKFKTQTYNVKLKDGDTPRKGKVYKGIGMHKREDGYGVSFVDSGELIRVLNREKDARLYTQILADSLDTSTRDKFVTQLLSPEGRKFSDELVKWIEENADKQPNKVDNIQAGLEKVRNETYTPETFINNVIIGTKGNVSGFKPYQREQILNELVKGIVQDKQTIDIKVQDDGELSIINSPENVAKVIDLLKFKFPQIQETPQFGGTERTDKDILIPPKPKSEKVGKERKESEKESKVIETVEKGALERAKDYYNKANKGEFESLDEFKTEAEFVMNNEDAIKKDISKNTVKKLKKELSYRAYGLDRKAQMVDRIYDDLVADIYYKASGKNTITYHFGEDSDKSLRNQINKAIEGLTPEKFKELQQATKEGYAKAIEDRKQRIQAFKEPKTLEDFETKKRHTKLTEKEQETYDELLSDKKYKDRQAEKEKKQQIETQDIGEYTITKDIDTRDKSDLWVIKLKDRVTGDAFKEIRSNLKKLDIGYSRYKRGFISKVDPTEKLKQLTGEKEVEKTMPEIKTNADKLNKLADGLQSKIDHLRRDRLTNTAKRARQSASALEESDNLEAYQNTLRNLADAMDKGELKYLSELDSMAQLDTLRSIMNRAKFNMASEIAKKDKDNFGLERIRKELSNKDIYDPIRYAQFPVDEIYPHILESLASKVENIAGFKLIANRFIKEAKGKKEPIKLTHRLKQDIDKINRAGILKDHDYIKELVGRKNRLERMGIETIEQLRSALRELTKYEGKSDVDTKAREIKAKESEILRRSKQFEGFYPTPKPLIEKMLDKVDIQKGDKVLEPSAGKGNILDVIKEKYPDNELKALELDYELRDLLKLKGYDVVGNDFLTHEGKYDKIIMNPPFEKLQDIDHVMKAYELLNDGGKMVAIMSESPFFRTGAKAETFREWLSEVNGKSVKNPEGSFKTGERSTGVNTRMVTIKKPAKEKPLEFDTTKFASDLGYTGRPESKGTSDIKDAITSTQIIDKIIKKFDDVVIRKGKTRKKSVLGDFNHKTNVIRLRKSNDIPTTIHEFAHYIDVNNGIVKNMSEFNRKDLASQFFTTQTPKMKLEAKAMESFAELVREYTVGGITAENSHWKKYSKFMSDDVLKFIDEIKKDVQTFINLNSADAVRKTVYAEGERKKTTKFNFKESMESLYTQFVDENRPVTRTAKELAGQRGMEQMLGRLAQLRGFQSTAEFNINPDMKKGYYQTDITGEKVGPALSDIMSDVIKLGKQAEDDFWRVYAVSRRAKDYKARNLEMPLNHKTYPKVVADMEKKYPVFKPTFNKILEFKKNQLQMLVDVGLKTQDQVDEIIKNNPNHINLFRILPKEGRTQGGSQKIGASKNPIKAIVGSGLDIIDPYESLIKMTYLYWSIARRQQVLKDLSTMADKSVGKGRIMATADKKYKIKKLNDKEVAKVVTNYFNRVFDALNVDESQIQELLGDIDEMSELYELGQILYNLSYQAGENQVTIYKNGKPKLYDINPVLYQSITRAEPVVSNALIRGLTKVGDFQAKTIMVKPTFPLRTAIREIGTDLILTKTGMTPLDIIKAYINVAGGNAIWREYEKQGGINTVYFAHDGIFERQIINQIRASKSKLDKLKYTLSRPFESIMDALSILDVSPKLAEFTRDLENNGHFRQGVTDALIEGFKNQTKKDLSDEFISMQSELNNISEKQMREAIYKARDISYDLSKKGSTMRKYQLNRIWRFSQSALQGTTNYARKVAIKSKSSRSTNKWKNVRDLWWFKDARMNQLLRGAFMTLLTIGLYSVNRKNEKYQEVDDWRKDGFWLVPLGDPDTTDKYIYIPKPFQEALLYSTIPERVLRDLEGDKYISDRAYENLSNTIISTFIPSTTPIVASPLWENALNESWNGIPIESTYEKQTLEPWMRYNDYTSQLAINFAHLVKDIPLLEQLKSPKQIDNLLIGYTNSLGQTILNSIDTVLGHKSPKDIFYASGFANLGVFDVSRSSKSVNEFYNDWTTLKRKLGTLKKQATEIQALAVQSKTNPDLQKTLDAYTKAFKKDATYYTLEKDLLSYYNNGAKLIKELRAEQKVARKQGNDDKAKKIQQVIEDIAKRVNAIEDLVYSR